MMRILFVASRFPHPPIQGDRVRSYYLLPHLRAQHEITLVTPVPGPPTPEQEAVARELSHHWYPVVISRWQRGWGLLREALGSLPWQTAYMCPPPLVRAVRRLLQERAFDVIHVQLARMAPVLPPARALPAVIDLVDALSLNMRRRAARERGPRRWLIAWEARKMARYEQQLIAQVDQLVLTSPLDWEALGRPANVHVIPNGVDLERFPFRLRGRDPATVVFTGRMGYFPNADAAVFFATQVFPRVRQAVPQARFLIVGADPPARVRRLARLPGVEVTGYVPRIQDYLQRATVAVAPLRAGSGIQNKVLEAMASGAPVVATSYALGGLQAQPGVHLLQADSPDALADAVVALLQNPAQREALARRARSFVEAHYTWSRAAAQFQQVYALARQGFRPPR